MSVAVSNTPQTGLQNVHRLYDATPSWHENYFFQKTTAQVRAIGTFPTVNTLLIPRDKPFRTIYAYLYNQIAVCTTIVFDVACYDKGLCVYRQQWINQDICNWSNTEAWWLANITNEVTKGAPVELMNINIQGSKFSVMPVYINLTCEQINLEVTTISETGGVSTWDCGLAVQSQRGI